MLTSFTNNMATSRRRFILYTLIALVTFNVILQTRNYLRNKSDERDPFKDPPPCEDCTDSSDVDEERRAQNLAAQGVDVGEGQPDHEGAGGIDLVDYEEEEEDNKDEMHGGTKFTMRTTPYLVENREKKAVKQRGLKYIAVYKKEFHEPTVYQGNELFSRCRFNHCMFTEDFTKADAVWFSERVLMYYPIAKFWLRNPRQRWIFHTTEPVIHNYGLNNNTIRSMFNWTATYKTDSDIALPMGLLKKRMELKPRKYNEIFAQKTKLAAWYVDQCGSWSLREIYMERMIKVAPVDIYGKCGPLSCGSEGDPDNYSEEDCLPLLKKYKFYFVFEDSLCRDYITPQFFKLFTYHQIIPVVRGGADYKHILPKNTFIDADDFDTPEMLMLYLIKLGKNEEEYTAMLKAKNKWEISTSPEERAWCRLCERIHTDSSPKYYEDIHQELNSEPNECWVPQDLGDDFKQLTMDTVIKNSPIPL